MPFETENWPFIEARWKKHVIGQRSVRLIVIHSTESLEIEGSAAGVARYFQMTTRPASAHVIVDDKQVIQAVHDNDMAAAAPGANGDGIHIEICGRAAQNEAQWRDAYSTAALDLAADVAAQYSLKYDIPVKWLTDEELRTGAKGIVGHAQVSRVYRKSTHTDPGEGFPKGLFIAAVSDYRSKRMEASK